MRHRDDVVRLFETMGHSADTYGYCSFPRRLLPEPGLKSVDAAGGPATRVSAPADGHKRPGPTLPSTHKSSQPPAGRWTGMDLPPAASALSRTFDRMLQSG